MTHISDYIYHIYISYIHSYQNSPIIMTNGIKKVRKGVDIFNKRIFDSCKLYLGQCFRIQPCLSQLSFPRSQHIINWYHSAWCTTYKDFTFYVSIFLVSGKREGEEKHRKTTPFLHYYFLFFQVGCTMHVIPHMVLFSHKPLERVVKEPGCSKLP